MLPSTQKANLLKENQKMKKLPKRIKMGLKREARAWDSSITKEKPEEVSGLLGKAQLFVARRRKTGRWF
jgi:hypothetical protein